MKDIRESSAGKLKPMQKYSCQAMHVRGREGKNPKLTMSRNANLLGGIRMKTATSAISTQTGRENTVTQKNLTKSTNRSPLATRVTRPQTRPGHGRFPGPKPPRFH
jgi:hypothetical protein